MYVLWCAVQAAACLYVNLTVIKSLSTHITAALFIYRLCSMIQTDAQGQPQSDEALTRTLTLAAATSNDTGFEWQGVQSFWSFVCMFASRCTSAPWPAAVIACLPCVGVCWGIKQRHAGTRREPSSSITPAGWWAAAARAAGAEVYSDWRLLLSELNTGTSSLTLWAVSVWGKEGHERRQNCCA